LEALPINYTHWRPILNKNGKNINSIRSSNNYEGITAV
jgi:hypothetical protein